MDLKASPELIPAANKNNRMLSTAFVISPGHWYERGLRSRQDILFFNNRDLVSLLSDDARVESAFKALDAAPIRWSIPRALPILLNDSWIPYKVGVERTGSSEEPPLKQLRD